MDLVRYNRDFELQKLYEAVCQRSFTRTNFQRRMLSLGILERLGKKISG